MATREELIEFARKNAGRTFVHGLGHKCYISAYEKYTGFIVLSFETSSLMQPHAFLTYVPLIPSDLVRHGTLTHDLAWLRERLAVSPTRMKNRHFHVVTQGLEHLDKIEKEIHAASELARASKPIGHGVCEIAPQRAKAKPGRAGGRGRKGLGRGREVPRGAGVRA